MRTGREVLGTEVPRLLWVPGASAGALRAPGCVLGV